MEAWGMETWAVVGSETWEEVAIRTTLHSELAAVDVSHKLWRAKQWTEQQIDTIVAMTDALGF